MSEIKKPRAMSAKRFAVAKLSGKSTAEGFIAAHMDFLRSHDFLAPILDAYDNGEVLPTPALQAMQSALMTFHLESSIKTAEARMTKSAMVVRRKPSANREASTAEIKVSEYTITLMVKVIQPDGSYYLEVGTVEKKMVREVEKNGIKVMEHYTETKPAIWSAHTYHEAQKLADRRLSQREDSVYATIENNLGKKVLTSITREAAMSRVYKQKKGPVSHVRGKSTKTLGWTPKMVQTRVIGPWSR